MIKSMTGYGKAEAVLGKGIITVEIRTLNGKNADVNIKTQLLPKAKEIVVRQLLADRLQRGTIDFFMSFEENAASKARQINAEMVEEYFKQISDIEAKVGLKSHSDRIIESILRFPEIFEVRSGEVLDGNNWPLAEKAIIEAIDKVNEFRSREGQALYKDVTSRINNIIGLSKGIEELEPQRIEAVKEKLSKAIEDLQAKPDQSRFEQELIFYLEKLDINEEKVRLRQHCKYFMDTINNEDAPGKKLGFIIQEIGREINTTGSKANNADIQKLVVMMKDEMEKMREQSMNIL